MSPSNAIPGRWDHRVVNMEPYSSDPDLIESIAAVAVTAAEMGKADEQLLADVGELMLLFEMTTANDVRAVAAAIQRLPQPLDQDAQQREANLPIENMLGIQSPEDQLLAALRAREALERFADYLDEQS